MEPQFSLAVTPINPHEGMRIFDIWAEKVYAPACPQPLVPADVLRYMWGMVIVATVSPPAVNSWWFMEGTDKILLYKRYEKEILRPLSATDGWRHLLEDEVPVQEVLSACNRIIPYFYYDLQIILAQWWRQELIKRQQEGGIYCKNTLLSLETIVKDAFRRKFGTSPWDSPPPPPAAASMQNNS